MLYLLSLGQSPILRSSRLDTLLVIFDIIKVPVMQRLFVPILWVYLLAYFLPAMSMKCNIIPDKCQVVSDGHDTAVDEQESMIQRET